MREIKRINHVFRMTHIDNIPHIIQYGITHANSQNSNPYYKTIGDSTLITNRINKTVLGISLGDCIPFYFGPRSPMLYVIQHGYNGVKQVKPEDIIYCVINISNITQMNFIFSDGHAFNSLTEFYPKERIIDLNKLISYQDVYATNWVTDDTDLKRRKEAECLFTHDILYETITGFVVYNEAAKHRMINMSVVKPIHIAPNCYF